MRTATQEPLTSSHRCLRCGASCQGLRVRVGEERERLAAAAETLGVERPFSGPYLRQNWGTCVFYQDGCRLHAELGIDAKPSVCKAFPVDFDPTCFHPGEQASTELWPEWGDLQHGLDARDWLRSLPLEAVRKPSKLGPLTAEALRGLDEVEPADPGEWTARLDWRARRARGRPSRLVGGAQLLAGAGRPGSFAAWVRLLRVWA